MVVIEYMLNQRRSASIALLMLNDAESADITYGISLGCDGLGIMCDTVGVFGWAEAYHRRAVLTASQLQDPRLLGISYFGLGFHELHVGAWAQAYDQFEQAATSLWQNGELHLWATIQMWIAFLIGTQRSAGEALERLQPAQCLEIWRRAFVLNSQLSNSSTRCQTIRVRPGAHRPA